MTYSRHYKALELNKILALCADLAVCEETKERILEIVPSDTFQGAVQLSALTADAQSLSNRFGNPGLYSVISPEQNVQRAKVFATLSMKELLDTASLLRNSRMLRNWRAQAPSETTSLDSLFEALAHNESLEKDIYDAILSPDEMADDASPELSNIRRNIASANSRARDTLERITRSSQYEKYLQEQIITIRNGRFVVPVRSEHKQEVKGLVHDTSASGATLFIEPMAVVELNNTIKELEAAQNNEINRILLAFSARVGEFGDSILSNYDVIIELDTIFAKSKLADKMLAGPTELIPQGETLLKKARHPLISKDNVVPIDIRIGGEFTTLVITGPNTGGKTVALKTLGLFTLMSLCGFLLPCAVGSRICFYKKVLADIGDEQSIEQSLSTFSSHMTNIISILEQADEESLVLIDELGAGTDPVEGAALAVAILGQLRNQKAVIAATTHYAEIKMYALQTDGVENASCEFDVATLRPTYRLLIGTLGKSNAFAISNKLGLSDDIIRVAEQQVSTENQRFEDVVASLEVSRQELEQEKQSAQLLRKQAEDIQKETQRLRGEMEKEKKIELEKARDQSQRIVASVRFQYDEIMKELETLRKQQQQGDSSSLAAARGDLRRQLAEIEDTANPHIPKSSEKYQLPRPLVQGDIVFLTTFNTEGTVLSPADNKDYVRVKAGILETKVPQSTLRLVENHEKVSVNGSKLTRKRAKTSTTPTKTEVMSELDLRGLDSLEAVMEVERFVDSAVLSNMGYVSIIHGKGTGVLRKSVQDYLRTHPSVAHFRLGEFGEGGAGVTIAELK